MIGGARNRRAAEQRDELAAFLPSASRAPNKG